MDYICIYVSNFSSQSTYLPFSNRSFDHLVFADKLQSLICTCTATAPIYYQLLLIIDPANNSPRVTQFLFITWTHMHTCVAIVRVVWNFGITATPSSHVRPPVFMPPMCVIRRTKYLHMYVCIYCRHIGSTDRSSDRIFFVHYTPWLLAVITCQKCVPRVPWLALK